MALTKQKVQDKIEIVSEFKHIQIRYANQIVEDGTVISSAFERTVVSCGDYDKADEHNVRAIADAVWNADLIAAYEAQIAQPEIAEECYGNDLHLVDSGTKGKGSRRG
jgi:hypothetical protein